MQIILNEKEYADLKAAAAPKPQPVLPFFSVEKLMDLEKVKRLYIRRAVAAHDGNIARTAAVIGVHRSTVTKAMRSK